MDEQHRQIVAAELDDEGSWTVLDAGVGAASFLSLFSGDWALDVAMAHYLVELASTLSAKDILQLQAAQVRSLDGGDGAEEPRRPYKVYDGVAHIPIVGVLTKRPAGCMQAMMDGPGTSTIRVRQMYRAAESDEAVQSKLQVIDSPGGEAAGCFDASNDVMSGKKPTDTFYEDYGASGAMLIGAGARHSSANSNAALGSVGVYTTVTDRSVMNDRMGARVHVVKAGRNKALGHPGVQTTPEDLAVIQSRVDAMHGLFLQHVVRGRPSMTKKQLADVADANVYIGAQAKAAGLIDSVNNLDEAHRQAVKSNAKGTRRVTMVKDAQLQAWLSGSPAPPDEDRVEESAAPASGAPPAPAEQASGGPLLAALKDIGVASVADLRALAEDALAGRAALSGLRERAVRLAVSNFKDGSPEGERAYLSAEKYINSAPIDLVQAAVDTYEARLRGIGLAAPQGGQAPRSSAPPRAGGEPVDATAVEPPPTIAQATDKYVSAVYGSHASNGKGA